MIEVAEPVPSQSGLPGEMKMSLTSNRPRNHGLEGTQPFAAASR
jgi:hypothetical protein